MEHIHSIILIKKDNKYLNYYDDRWGMYLFPNIKGNDIEKIKEKYRANNVKFLFDKEASYVVKKIFNMILLGNSRKEIAEHLNSKNILTPSLYKLSK